uniref:Uncharacterized protein n=1 Tax=Amphimedon queenslandica TaxID=400682 RepID=A0A1X7VJ39_AMPQE
MTDSRPVAEVDGVTGEIVAQSEADGCYSISNTRKVHGNTVCIPCHALSVEGIKNVVAFLENYAVEYAILLPATIPGVRDYEKAKLLPSSVFQHMV